MTTNQPNRELRRQVGITPISNFFLLFWAPILGPIATMIYIQILRLSGRDKRQVTISIQQLKQLVGVTDNRTFKNYLAMLKVYGFIVFESNNLKRYKHRLNILVEDLPMYLDIKDVVKLPLTLQRKYNKFLTMAHLTPHEALSMDKDTVKLHILPLVNSGTADNGDIASASIGNITNVDIGNNTIIYNKGNDAIRQSDNSCVCSACAQLRKTGIPVSSSKLMELIGLEGVSTSRAKLAVAYTWEVGSSMKSVGNWTGLLRTHIKKGAPTGYGIELKNREAKAVARAIEVKKAKNKLKKENELQEIKWKADMAKAKEIYELMSVVELETLRRHISKTHPHISALGHAEPFSRPLACAVYVSALLAKSIQPRETETKKEK